MSRYEEYRGTAGQKFTQRNCLEHIIHNDTEFLDMPNHILGIIDTLVPEKSILAIFWQDFQNRNLEPLMNANDFRIPFALFRDYWRSLFGSGLSRFRESKF